MQASVGTHRISGYTEVITMGAGAYTAGSRSNNRPRYDEVLASSREYGAYAQLLGGAYQNRCPITKQQWAQAGKKMHVESTPTLY